MNNMNKNKEEDKLFELYTLAELSYQNHFKDTIDDIEDLYPVSWYEKKNYKEKIEIISEAIKTDTLIVNTPSYQNMIEGVERKLKKDL